MSAIVRGGATNRRVWADALVLVARVTATERNAQARTSFSIGYFPAEMRNTISPLKLVLTALASSRCRSVRGPPLDPHISSTSRQRSKAGGSRLGSACAAPKRRQSGNGSGW